MIPSVPNDISNAIESLTGAIVRSFSFCSGGCINHGGKLTTSQGVFFLKWNDATRYPDMFASEAAGLKLLREAGALAIPDVIMTGVTRAHQFLLLEHVGPGERVADYWEKLGAGLARLHACSAPQFGLAYDNYIGSLSQKNTQTIGWPEFFVEHRLRAQLTLAGEKLDRGTRKKFDKLFELVPGLVPDEPASLLHGDLWGGNLVVTREGAPCLIDPAVYYGHREVDLAMTQLFGGFNAAFFDSYRAAWPLPAGYQERFDLYNLYPLLVHVNLFGGGYKQQVAAILDRFV